MVEWSITTVLKTVVLRGTGGSNPSLSAINIENQCFTNQTPDFTPKNVKLGVFLFKVDQSEDPVALFRVSGYSRLA